jgi:putative tricarboxylic transport membrane protein
MIAVLKKNPKSLSIYNGNGLGSPTHIAIASMAKSAGIDPTALKLVSYGSGGVAMASLLGGHIDVHVATGASVVPRFEEGVIRILGVSAPKRLGGSIAGVPTWKEQGFEFEAERSTTIFGPKGLSKDQIAYWDGILAKMVKTEQWKKSAAKGFRENTYFNSTATVKYLDKAHKDLTEIMTKLDLIQK